MFIKPRKEAGQYLALETTSELTSYRKETSSIKGNHHVQTGEIRVNFIGASEWADV